ncbi:MAG: 16S rRNA (guanine(527)-N(7))-methyltransferase RsmG [Betaproteobacteria bacterium]|nr:16S rRNA (guanine(527)-N(7))-methyltransferase RsmG [Betaproteobacteria bacterium]
MISAPELHKGAAKLEVALSPEQETLLLRYLELLKKWNQVYNLTAIREDEKLVSYHVLDSLAIAPYVVGDSLLDIGTGPGLPGIPLAVARPEVNVVLLDSNHKKTTFLRQAVAELGLSNAEVLLARAETYQPLERFSVITSRAFSDLKTFTEVSRHLIRSDGVLLAMKGTYPNEELEQLPSYARAEKIDRLAVPGLNAERHLVVIKVGLPREPA